MNIGLCAESPRRGLNTPQKTKEKIRETLKKHFQTEEGNIQKNKCAHRAEQHPFAKLNWEKVREIRYKFANKMASVVELAEQYGTKKSAIYNIVKKITWTEDNSYHYTNEIHEIFCHGRFTVNKDTVKQIREQYKKSQVMSQDVDKQYKLSWSGYRKIIHNSTWQDEEYGAWYKDNVNVCVDGSKKPTRINYETAEQIRKEYLCIKEDINCGQKYKMIAERYNLSADTVRKIVKNKMWTTPNKSY
jgi:Mor family transcriptional regulator